MGSEVSVYGVHTVQRGGGGVQILVLLQSNKGLPFMEAQCLCEWYVVKLLFAMRAQCLYSKQWLEVRCSGLCNAGRT